MNEAAYKVANIPKRYWELSLDDFDESTTAIKVVGEYVDHLDDHLKTGRGLLLVGAPGRGKTALACVVAMAAVESKLPAFYMTLMGYKQMLLDQQDLKHVAVGDPELREDWARGRERLLNIRNRFSFLVIDDVGKEHSTTTNFIEDEFDFLVRHRFDRALPTIITTNVPLDRWSDRYSEAMQDFLHEACEIVAVTGKSRRR